MVGDTQQTVFSEPVNARQALATPNASVSNAEIAFSSVAAFKFGYLLNLLLICTTASTTIGLWTFKSSVGGTSIFTFPQPVAVAAVGTQYLLTFDMPWKTPTTNAAFSITPSVATMGTWFLLPNGFYSST